MPHRSTSSQSVKGASVLLLSLFLLAFGIGLSCTIARPSRLEKGSDVARIPHELNPYLVQMHIHGLSNHNGNPLPASMESQSFEARRHGFDVIWWSDHSRIFEPYRDDKTIGFASALVDKDQTSHGSWTIRVGGLRRGLSLLSAQTSSEGCRVEVDQGSLFVIFDEIKKNLCERALVLRTSSSIGKVKQLEFCRPVASGLEFKLWGRFHALRTCGVRLRIGFDLSWHPNGQHHLLFEIGEGKVQGMEGDTLVVSSSPLDSMGVIRLDLENASRLLPMGYDNSLSDIWMEFKNSKCSACTISIDSFAIHSRKPHEEVYMIVEELAKIYETRYEVIEHIGVELGSIHRILNPHINVFLPETAMGLWVVEEYHSKPLKDFVRSIHRRGGLVSFNHPFGASRMDRAGQVLEEDLYNAAPIELWKSGMRMDQEGVEEAAIAMLKEGAFGADILEVGYLFRGTGSLDDHLKLWDILLSSGLRIIGNGVSDSHGGFWGREMVPGNFATWIWARSASATDLIEGLKLGRVAFGDPFLWRGRFSFGIEDAMMGDTLEVDGSKDLWGWMIMEPPLENPSVRVIHAMVGNQEDVGYVKRETIAGLPDHISISPVTPSFVRIEIYDASGNPVVFSNPVFLVSGNRY